MTASRPSTTTLAASLAVLAAFGVGAWVLMDGPSAAPASASAETSTPATDGGPQGAEYRAGDPAATGGDAAPPPAQETAGAAAPASAEEGRLQVVPPPPVGKVDDIVAELDRLDRERAERERLAREQRLQDLQNQADALREQFGLDANQTIRVRDLLVEREDAIQALRAQHQSGIQDREAWAAGWASLRERFEAGLGNVLTPEQMEAYRTTSDGGSPNSNGTVIESTVTGGGGD